ncbi:uncharacterized protein AMSG_10414 [Thecamonas trahens ATCC 50062]|uniref:MYND-type domain-containing protein n=1 Tax=Thecamonas trahens ATCC 50062 TaxID=461836 RepID=A0A0L0DT13_THETB|nr:hypothetical protein AMSG_10414 [Thecamonas trahens ATCC 50062]KNC54563.1 hypothetical protein AMSG_10414 [Thecamonas trahens ATCC 50062]|eukprot:XP_013753578.1 hypothetical protein AMSG_10414 [Thecamonas trahens ATCC 50062]
MARYAGLNSSLAFLAWADDSYWPLIGSVAKLSLADMASLVLALSGDDRRAGAIADCFHALPPLWRGMMAFTALSDVVSAARHDAPLLALLPYAVPEIISIPLLCESEHVMADFITAAAQPYRCSVDGRKYTPTDAEMRGRSALIKRFRVGVRKSRLGASLRFLDSLMREIPVRYGFFSMMFLLENLSHMVEGLGASLRGTHDDDALVDLIFKPEYHSLLLRVRTNVLVAFTARLSLLVMQHGSIPPPGARYTLPPPHIPADQLALGARLGLDGLRRLLCGSAATAGDLRSLVDLLVWPETQPEPEPGVKSRPNPPAHSSEYSYESYSDDDVQEAPAGLSTEPAASAAGCASCGKATEALKRCSRCRAVRYCSRACQVGHWKTHKPQCQATGES